MIKTEIGKKNASSIPSPKHVIAKPTALFKSRIAIHPVICFLLLLYVFQKKRLKIFCSFSFFAKKKKNEPKRKKRKKTNRV